MNAENFMNKTAQTNIYVFELESGFAADIIITAALGKQLTGTIFVYKISNDTQKIKVLDSVGCCYEELLMDLIEVTKTGEIYEMFLRSVEWDNKLLHQANVMEEAKDLLEQRINTLKRREGKN